MEHGKPAESAFGNSRRSGTWGGRDITASAMREQNTMVIAVGFAHARTASDLTKDTCTARARSLLHASSVSSLVQQRDRRRGA